MFCPSNISRYRRVLGTKKLHLCEQALYWTDFVNNNHKQNTHDVMIVNEWMVNCEWWCTGQILTAPKVVTEFIEKLRPCNNNVI